MNPFLICLFENEGTEEPCTKTEENQANKKEKVEEDDEELPEEDDGRYVVIAVERGAAKKDGDGAGEDYSHDSQQHAH